VLKILVADPIAEPGLALLRAQGDIELDVRHRLTPQELVATVPHYDALIVRSETQVTAQVLEAGKRLQVVGRAGVGVDNIDLEAATRRGVAVVNAPTGNTVAAAEHTIAVLLALARNIPQADASLKRGEWRRTAFIGVEIRGKTLGIIGLGRVGSEVARRARGLEMRLLAYDPFVAPERASQLGVELAPLARVLAESDFLTLHTPLTDTTRRILGPQELALVKRGVRIVNVARGGLVDEEALLRALEQGTVGGAALDVFDHEPPGESPLVRHPHVVTTPHLGASTMEAQDQVAREVAEQVLAVLRGQPAQYTVNAPFLPPEAQALLAPYLRVAADVGRIAIQLIEGQLSSITLRLEGEIGRGDTRSLRSGALVGLLEPISEERVNLVNAGLLAEQRGLRIVEERSETAEQYANLVTAEIQASGGSARVSGTYLRGQTHIVRIGRYWLDAVLESSYLLVIDHHDSPGLIGAVGSITGHHDINISSMAVGRLEPRGRATMVVALDDPMPEEVLAKIRAIPRIYSARVVRL
jgi:D-3-phosphoglycerate dehydrogenase